MAESLRNGDNKITPSEYLKLSIELATAQRDIDKITIEAAAARGVKAGILRRAKLIGADKDVMLDLAKYAQMDEAERTEYFATMAQYAGWSSIKLFKPGMDAAAFQGALFDDEPALQRQQQTLIDGRVHEAGYKARRKGTPRFDGDRLHEPGSRAHQTWNKGWLDCDRDLKSAGIEVAIADPKPGPQLDADGNPVVPTRGRPKGSTNKPKAGAPKPAAKTAPKSKGKKAAAAAKPAGDPEAEFDAIH